MQKTISVADLKLEQRLDTVPFSLKDFEKKMSRAMKPYYNVLLGDKTGDIRAKIWSEAISFTDESAKIGDIVSISGLVQEYADKPQIIIEKLAIVHDMAPDEFLPVTSRDRASMEADMTAEIEATKNPHLKSLLESFWNNQELHDKYVNFPAAEYVHHGYVGGLLEHVWEMNMMSKPYFQLYPQLDRDMFFTGLFFHDIGKLEELDILGSAIIRTNEGKLIAHVGQGVIFLANMLEKFPDFPTDLKTKLMHMVLSHQGSLEFGSPIVPQTLEALVLSFVDKNGDDMNQAIKHIEKELETGADFTGYQKWLKRSFYQKDYLLAAPDNE